MAVIALGISYRRAPIELLEQLWFDDDSLSKAYRSAADTAEIEELVILSTCNRVELYGWVLSYHGGFRALKELMLQTGRLDAESLAEPLYAHWEHDAADHLASVASGLDSMVIGEAQIGRQVKEALLVAEREDAAGPALRSLFQAATRAGRRVRAETALGKAPDAYVAMGTDLAAELLGGIEGRSVAIVGAGQMASLAASRAKQCGAAHIRILNRSLDRARSLAERQNADHADLDALPEAIAEADLVVAATGATLPVVTEEVAEPAIRRRSGAPIVFLDLAVPRDVEPAVARLPGAQLLDVNDLRARVAEHGEATAEEVGLARTIVDEEVHRYDLKRRGEAMGPLITAMRQRGDQIIRLEMDRRSSELADLSPGEREAVEALARGIVAKLIHDPIAELKERSGPGTDGAHARLLAELFRVEPKT